MHLLFLLLIVYSLPLAASADIVRSVLVCPKPIVDANMTHWSYRHMFCKHALCICRSPSPAEYRNDVSTWKIIINEFAKHSQLNWLLLLNRIMTKYFFLFYSTNHYIRSVGWISRFEVSNILFFFFQFAVDFIQRRSVLLPYNFV